MVREFKYVSKYERKKKHIFAKLNVKKLSANKQQHQNSASSIGFFPTSEEGMAILLYYYPVSHSVNKIIVENVEPPNGTGHIHRKKESKLKLCP